MNKSYFTIFLCLFCILSPLFAGNTHEELKWNENTQEQKGQSTSIESATFEKKKMKIYRFMLKPLK